MADADDVPVPVGEVARLLGPTLPRAALDAALAALRARALVWDSGGDLTEEPPPGGVGSSDMRRDLALVPAVRDVVSRFPGGLGRPAAGVAASSALPELLAAVEPDERRVLETLAAGPPVGRSRGGADPANPVSRLLARGLLVRVDAETVELPRQVGLALRGDRPLGALALDPPDLVTPSTAASTPSTAPPPSPRCGCCARSSSWSPSGAPRRRRRCARAASACASCAGWRARWMPTRPRPRCSSSSRSRRTSWRRATAWLRNGCPPPQRTSGRRRARAEVGQGGPGLARPPAGAGHRRHPRRRRAADRGARRRAAPADGSARPPSGARRARGAAAGNRSGRGRPSARRPARVAGTATGRPAARRGRAVDAGRGDGAGPRGAGRTVDPGTDTARGAGPRGGGAARGAARRRSTTCCCRPT